MVVSKPPIYNEYLLKPDTTGAPVKLQQQSPINHTYTVNVSRIDQEYFVRTSL
jgi:hypothetical protein